MRLSMWVISDWLKEYKQDVYIKDGQRTMRSVRIFSDDLNLSRTTLYLSKHDEDHILCTNDHDIIVLHTSDILDVFNKILDAFEYYNEASGDLHNRIRDGAELEYVLKSGNELLGSFLILADPTFYVLGTCGDLDPFHMKAQIQKVFQEKLLPIDSLLRINADPKIRRSGVGSYFVEMPEMECTAAVSNLFLYGEHKGWLISIRPENNYTKGELDLQDAFAESVCEWIARNDVFKDKLAKNELFIELIENGPENISMINKRLEPFGWLPEDEKYLYIIRGSEKSEELSVVQRLAEHRFSECFVFGYKGEVLMLLNTRVADVSYIEEQLGYMLEKCRCFAGRSPLFTALGSLSKQYNAAHIASEEIQENGTILRFEDHITKYLASLINENSVVDPVHPAIHILEEYDRKRNQDLIKTLKVFLMDSMNYTDTSKDLFIHRSSLLYRLSKIEELTGVDLKDPKERLWLELSFELVK